MNSLWDGCNIFDSETLPHTFLLQIFILKESKDRLKAARKGSLRGEGSNTLKLNPLGGLAPQDIFVFFFLTPLFRQFTSCPRMLVTIAQRSVSPQDAGASRPGSSENVGAQQSIVDLFHRMVLLLVESRMPHSARPPSRLCHIHQGKIKGFGGEGN